MERKKKREKPLANGSATDGASGQPGDVHQWQREVEQQGNAKKLASAATNDSPTQHFLPSFNWSFAQLPSAQQQSAQALMPQPHGQVAQQQATSQQGPQGGSQQLLSGSQLGWQNPEAFGQSAGPAHHHPFQPGPGESNWQQASAGAQGMGGRPSPFTIPPPPYPGPWDPVSWWGHNPYQPPYPYLFAGYGGGYPCPMPPAPPIGTNQRGLIKPPPGLSQKHVRIWEAQSMENMQLWSTTAQLWAAVARADAEISLQRSKILKLEADLQAIKVHPGGQMPQMEATAAPQPVARRGRRKKSTPAPLATVAGLPAAESIPLRTPGRKARANTSKVDLAKKAKEVEPEEKEKSTLANHVSGLVYRPPTDGQDQKSCSLTVGLIRNESGFEKSPLRQTVEYHGSTNDRLTVAKDDLAFGHVNHHISPYRSNSLPPAGKDSNCEQSLEMKESIVVSFLKNAGNLDHQGVITGDSPFTAAMNRGDSCLDANGNDTAKDVVVRSQLQAHYDTNNIEKSNALNLGKAIPSWQYAGEDGSDEQDEGVASAQDDEEADDDDDEDDEDDETTLDDMHSEKVGNYMVLDTLSMKW